MTSTPPHKRMKAAVTNGMGDLRMAEPPIPEWKDYRCLCKILACATCSGTDRKILKNQLPFHIPYPSIPGHESVGEVLETGERARYVEQGDLFLRPAAVYPGEQLGKYFSSWGGFAEYGLITDVKAFMEDCPDRELNPYTKYQQKIPGDAAISPVEATMLITLKEIAGLFSNMGPMKDSSILILGTGPVAKNICRIAKSQPARSVIIAGRRAEALEWLQDAGPDHLINIKEDLPFSQSFFTR